MPVSDMIWEIEAPSRRPSYLRAARYTAACRVVSRRNRLCGYLVNPPRSRRYSVRSLATIKPLWSRFTEVGNAA
jgi:hypothetical protein